MAIAQGESAKYVCDQMGHCGIRQQAMFTGRENGFGSSLEQNPENAAKRRSRGKTKADLFVFGVWDEGRRSLAVGKI
jgi:hypothetical protein